MGEKEKKNDMQQIAGGGIKWLREGSATHLFSLCNIDCVLRAGADVAGVILEKQCAGQELWVLVISIQDSDGDVGAGIEVLSSVHFLKQLWSNIFKVGMINSWLKFGVAAPRGIVRSITQSKPNFNLQERMIKTLNKMWFDECKVTFTWKLSF